MAKHLSESTNHRILITTGDLDGIGLEVASKALIRLGRKKNVQFLLWRDKNPNAHLLGRLKDRFPKRALVSSLEEALKIPEESSSFVDISSSLPPAKWVELSAKHRLAHPRDALVTGPLSKTGIYASGVSAMGHTEILKNVSGVARLHMGFIGERFNVVLATDHIPLQRVSTALDSPTLESAIRCACQLRAFLSRRLSVRPIAVLGLNPHAGEEGLLGTEESEVIAPTIQKFEKRLRIEGPLVPDAAFSKSRIATYSVFVSMYHDQGLIPFKSHHSEKGGVHMTLGLPFVRTSVDHGTAKDIFGKNRANELSMLNAIKTAIRALSQKEIPS